MMTRFFFSIGENVKWRQGMRRLWAHFRATDFAAPILDTVWSSMEKFQDLAMRLAVSVLLPGTTWTAFLLLMDLNCPITFLFGKRMEPSRSLRLLDLDRTDSGQSRTQQEHNQPEKSLAKAEPAKSRIWPDYNLARTGPVQEKNLAIAELSQTLPNQNRTRPDQHLTRVESGKSKTQPVQN